MTMPHADSLAYSGLRAKEPEAKAFPDVVRRDKILEELKGMKQSSTE